MIIEHQKDRNRGTDIDLSIILARLTFRVDRPANSLLLFPQPAKRPSSSFLTALTRGGPPGHPRPIELHAHDPLGNTGVIRLIVNARDFAQKGMMDHEEEWIRELMDAVVGKFLYFRGSAIERACNHILQNRKHATMLQINYEQNDWRAASITLKEITDVAYKTFFNSVDCLLSSSGLRRQLPHTSHSHPRSHTDPSTPQFSRGTKRRNKFQAGT
ncbi:hypothetical protein FB446DRAFT_794510 [Lentinula raphanica]|nr:hypothetical protein FB446DRAFT_794510 [Lentinula raphanica]